jgi:transposase
MDVLYPHCAGLDVHKKSLTACRLSRDTAGKDIFETRKFSTMTSSLLQLSDWLQAEGVTHIAMESTGEYWKPVYNILEGGFESSCLMVVNAHHVKNVPGRKTDDNDAEWLAQLLQHGLVRPSFIPPPGQRELRELTRHRTNFVRERVNLSNRLQKTLESANIKLASVATDVLGKSGRAILGALVGGETDAALMAELSLGRLREKRDQLAKALEGRMKPHHRFILGELLCQIDMVDETISRFDAAILEACAPFEEAVKRLDTIPGIGQRAAEQIVAEIGTDMSRFPTDAHLSAWGGLAPGNHESAGKKLSGRIRQGSPTIRHVLVQAAHAAAHTKDTYLSAQYHRLAARRGRKRAIVAVAHSILVICYHLLKRNEDYHELGGSYFDQRQPYRTARNLITRLRKLGYEIQLNREPEALAAA